VVGEVIVVGLCAHREYWAPRTCRRLGPRGSPLTVEVDIGTGRRSQRAKFAPLMQAWCVAGGGVGVRAVRGRE
jgi:hypothetical protein